MRATWAQPLLPALLALRLLCAPVPASAHPLAPASLRLVERAGGAPGTFDVEFRSAIVRPAGVRLDPRLPDACVDVPGRSFESIEGPALRQVRVVRCAGGPPATGAGRGLGALEGARLAVRGVARTGENVVVEVTALGGGHAVGLLHAGAESVVLHAARARASGGQASFVRLGAEHLATGFDHILFVLGLVLSVARLRPLVALLTAFTVGHAVSLGLASSTRVPVPAAFVEVAIAASLLWLGLRLLDGLDTPATDGRSSADLAPSWLVCVGFGLVHGLGFAGAFTELGVTRAVLPRALLGFNVGLELAQLGLVVPFALALRALRARPSVAQLEAPLVRVAAHVVGGVAAYLVLVRLPDALAALAVLR